VTYYQHQLDPIAFSLGGLSFPWYWLNYVVGFFWCYYGLIKLFSYDFPNREKDVANLCLKCWIGLIVGARITYVLVYQPKLYWEHPDQIIAIWNGGMSFHGGLLGIAVASTLGTKSTIFSLWDFTDRLSVLIPWPLMTGRICNFVNGELPGRVTDVAWAVVFPDPWGDAPRHPSQLYEAITEGLVLGVLMIWIYRRSHYQKGVLSAVFIGFYGILRFFTEFTREADPQLGFVLHGLTMGQMLCMIMVSCSVVMMHRLKHHGQR
jgi:phosphatidylglycerol---prolipoprotein diacylglyceryl transferase